MLDRPGRYGSRGQRCGNTPASSGLAGQALRSRQDHQVHHCRADQELLFRSPDAAEVKPPHAMLAFGIGEEPLDPAPQSHGPLEEPGFQLGSGKIPGVLIVEANQCTTTRLRACLPKHAAFAVLCIGGITMHASGQMEGVVPERLSDRTGEAVGVTVIAECRSRQLSLRP